MRKALEWPSESPSRLGKQNDEEPTEFHDSGLGTTLKTGSKYAGSQASFQSFMSSTADIEGGNLRLPPLPSKDLSGTFACNLCGTPVCDVNNKVQWRHVLVIMILELSTNSI